MLTGVEFSLGAERVYNMRIAEYHTYFVGSGDWGFSVWTHNNDAIDPCGPPNPVQSAPNGVQANQQAGKAREAAELADLKAKNPDASIQPERYLRTADGKRAVDPLTGESRRVDFAVVKDKKAIDLVETTSQTADKAAQIAKENRIREAGGTFIRDKTTKELIDVTDVPTRINRRD